MQKLFGEYLVEKKIVEIDVLVNALVEQVSGVPSALEVVYRQNLLERERIFEVVALQARNQISFQEACQVLGVWNDGISQKIEEESKKERIPIGQVLVKRGDLDFETLSGALDRYTSEYAQESSTQVQTELDPEFSDVGEDILQDYVDLLNEDRRSEVELLILGWEKQIKAQSTGELESSFRRVYREYHTIKGSARFIRADLTEKLVHLAEDLLSFCQRILKELNQEDCTKLVSLNLGVLDLVWNLKEKLQESRSERKFWETAELREKYLVVHQGLKDLSSELSSKEGKIDLDAVADEF